MGSQLVRFGQEGGVRLLRLSPSAPVVATPLAAYGTIGYNDSGAVGIATIGMKEVTFQLVGPGATTAGYSITIYGTITPSLLTPVDNQPGILPWVNLTGSIAVAPTDWDPLPGPSEQGSTGGIANPLVSGGVKLLVSKSPFVCYRAVLTTKGAPTDNVDVLMFAVG